MRHTPVTPSGDRLRWVELPGADPARVYIHGLGASSPAYFAAVAARPALSGRRSLLADLLGFGLSDRPTDFPYTMEAHADALAVALRAAGVAGAEVIGHSMGGTVAVQLAARHPDLVSALVLVDANLDPVVPSRWPGSSGIATFTEEEFLNGGRRAVRESVGPFWWATMRLAGPEALHRTAVHLARADVRELLLDLPVPRTFLHPAQDGEPAGAARLRSAGVRVTAVPDCGHNIMIDNPEGFVRAVAGPLAR
ncbi:alpha/beta hydrolase [Streptomyces sp. CB03911]|uniref:alpha/beta fold hydrolase n=1 Tax=Streptomyces sp. CB03911 TaxID=1804758 RepID=UPI0009398CB7|nr:alpha/beta hydrolase [Streptomyces sp. CB03911]OKI21792.1 alpha/beta hydrolase [Streptomyces sp. CB03911]